MPAETSSIIYYAVVEDLKNLKLTTRDIARRNGVSAPTLYKFARKANVDMEARDKARIAGGLRTFGVPPLSVHRPAILEDLRGGILTATEIAKAYDVSIALVSTIAKEHGIKIGHRRILIGQLEHLNKRKVQLEERLASIISEIELKQGFLVGKDAS